MSTRYVWSKSNIAPQIGATYSGGNTIFSYRNNSAPYIYYSSIASPSGSDIVLSGSIGHEYVNPGQALPDWPLNWSGPGYLYILDSSSQKVPSKGLFYLPGVGQKLERSGGSVGSSLNVRSGETVYMYTGYAAGTAVGTVSNASSSTYPPQYYAPKFARIWP